MDIETGSEGGDGMGWVGMSMRFLPPPLLGTYEMGHRADGWLGSENSPRIYILRGRTLTYV